MGNKKNKKIKNLRDNEQKMQEKQAARVKKGNERTVTFIGILLILIGVTWIVVFSQSDNPKVIMRSIVSADPNAVISVGVWDGDSGKTDMYIYTNKGKKDFVEYRYQIGSITKTFVGALIARESYNGNLDINDPIGNYLELPEGCYNPTFKDLITHHSGLSTQWEEVLEISNNSDKSTFYSEPAFSREDMINTLANSGVKQGNYPFEYSNFGAALAGTAVANEIVSEASYQMVMYSFIRQDLQLEDTYIAGYTSFDNNLCYLDDDEMMAACAMQSTVPDLLEFAKKFYFAKGSEYEYLTQATQKVAEVNDDYDIGYFWIIDKENQIIWHNGEVNNEYEGEDEQEVGFMSFLGYSLKTHRIVVVLSNSIAYDDDGESALTDYLGYLLLMR